jgi:hypothetical protein
MAKFLSTNDIKQPVRGSSDILEAVKHFVSEVDFIDLQTQVNDWLLLLNSNVIENRPSIRNISFAVYSNPNDEDSDQYLCQIHYVLTGDADDSSNL